MKDNHHRSKSRSASPQDRRSPSKSLQLNSSPYPERTEGGKKSPSPERRASPKGNQSPVRTPSKSSHHIITSSSPKESVLEAINSPSPNQEHATSPGYLEQPQEEVNYSSAQDHDSLPTESQSPSQVDSTIQPTRTPETVQGTEKNDKTDVQEAVKKSSTQECNSPALENHSLSQPDCTISYTQIPETLEGMLNGETEKRSPSPRKHTSPSQSPRFSPILRPVSLDNKGSKRSPGQEHTPPKGRQNGVQSPSSACTSPFYLEGTPEKDQKSSPNPEANVQGSGSDAKESNGKRTLDSSEETESVSKHQQRLNQNLPGSPLRLLEKNAIPDHPGTSTSDAHRSPDPKSTETDVTSLPLSPGSSKQPDDGHTKGVPKQGQPATDEVSKEQQIYKSTPGIKKKELTEAQGSLTDLATKYCGVYNVKQNSLTLTLEDPAMTDAFRDDLRFNTVLKRLDITMDDTWLWTELDLKSIADAIVETNISQFILDGNGCVTENKQLLERVGSDGRTVFGYGHTTPPRTGMLSGPHVGKLGLGTRFDPLIQLMAHPQLKQFHVKGMPELLKEFDCDLPKDLTHLDILQMDLNISDWEGIHAARFHDLITRCTQLRCLVLGCWPDKYHVYLERTRHALAQTPTRKFPVQVQLFSMGRTHMVAEFNERLEMSMLGVHLQGSNGVEWVPVLMSRMTRQLRELRLDYLECHDWAEPLLGWLKDLWSSENELRELRMNWPSVPLEAVPRLGDIFKLAKSPKVRMSKPCMHELWKGFETAMVHHSAWQASMRQAAQTDPAGPAGPGRAQQ